MDKINSIENITNEIIKNAKMEVNKKNNYIIKKREKELNELKENLKKKYEKELVDYSEFCTFQIEKAEILILLEEKNELLKFKHKKLDEIFEAIFIKINKLKNSDYEKIIFNVLISSIEIGNETIVFSKKIKDKLSENFLNKLKMYFNDKFSKNKIIISESNNDNFDNIVIKNEEYEYEFSFEKIMKELRKKLENEIANILFN